jgi:hypothetical protein
MGIKQNKKAYEMNQQLIITVLSVIFIILLVLFGINSCSLLKEKSRQLTLLDLEGEIRGAAELLASRYEVIKHHTFLLPEGVDQVCFVDLNHSDVIIENTSLTRNYPQINHSLVENNNKNMFLLDGKEVVNELNAGNICFDYYPFYDCRATPNNVLDVWFEGRAGCTTLWINWSMFPDNSKHSLLNNALFLIQEINIGEEIDNWKEILSVVPLTLFREKDVNGVYQTYTFKYTVAYKPSNNLDFNNINTLLTDADSKQKTYVFDTNIDPIGTLCPGCTISLRSTTQQDYFDFWSQYYSIILVDTKSESAGLIASLLAGYVNTPLIFIDDTLYHSNEEFYQKKINGKQIFIITSGNTILDNDIFTYVKNYASRYQLISDTLLQSHGEIPAFAELYSEINLIT